MQRLKDKNSVYLYTNLPTTSLQSANSNVFICFTFRQNIFCNNLLFYYIFLQIILYTKVIFVMRIDSML